MDTHPRAAQAVYHSSTPAAREWASVGLAADTPLWEAAARRLAWRYAVDPADARHEMIVAILVLRSASPPLCIGRVVRYAARLIRAGRGGAYASDSGPAANGDEIAGDRMDLLPASEAEPIAQWRTAVLDADGEAMCDALRDGARAYGRRAGAAHATAQRNVDRMISALATGQGDLFVCAGARS